MIFCNRKDCGYNEEGFCEEFDSIMLSDEGICIDYVHYDFRDDLDDIEREEYMRIYSESEEV